MKTKELSNKRKGLTLFLLTCLVMNFSLLAQVTVGGLQEPAKGAILDLNSTVKGGLVLSNVAISAPTVIPSNFPEASNEEETALKAGLTGAMVYNTNANLCTGVHVWNGGYWERIAPSPIEAPGTTLTSPNAANLFGGDIANFTASFPGAKTYRWYDGDEFLGITTDPSFSKAFSADNHRVKVIADDCRTPTESNELSFAPSALSPNFGSTVGGNYIYIYGNFQYAATGDYAQNGLVAHYDGINNQGLGDKQHDYNATGWKDLKNDFELPRLTDVPGQWLANGFQSLTPTVTVGTSDYATNALFYRDSFPSSYPVGNAPRTVEVIFRTPDEDNMFVQALNVERTIFLYGETVNYKQFGLLYRGLTRPACPNGNAWIFYPIAGGIANLISCLSSTPSLETPNTINTVTSTYQDSMKHVLTNSFINNTPAYIIERVASLNTGTNIITIGTNLPHATFLSVRLYNRVLEAHEIERNAELDQARYLSPPEVTIGGKKCTEVVVLSPNHLMCKVPAGDATGPAEVTVNGKSYGNVYEYVDPVNDFYISGISPIIGSVGTILTLTGNKLDEIDQVEAGGKVCSVSGTPNSTTYKCTLPDNPKGETDITITLSDGTVYHFAKVFEYN